MRCFGVKTSFWEVPKTDIFVQFVIVAGFRMKLVQITTTQLPSPGDLSRIERQKETSDKTYNQQQGAFNLKRNQRIGHNLQASICKQK
jgi:hypothetical protein